MPLHISEITIRVAVESAAGDVPDAVPDSSTDIPPAQQERIVTETMRRVLRALNRSERR